MQRSFLKLVLTFWAALAVVLTAGAALQLAVPGMSGLDLRWHKARYEAVVAGMREVLVQENVLMEFEVADLEKPVFVPLNLTGNQPLSTREAAHDVVGIRRGDLVQVWIEVTDLHHAGAYGFAYSSDDSVPRWRADDWGERWTVAEQVADHWYWIYFDLG